MKAITSRDNPLYKRLKALAGSTHQQRRSGHALLEGFHLASAYLDVAGQPEMCIVTEGALRHDEAQAIVSRIDEHRIVTLPDALFGQVSNVVHGVGILLLVEKLDTPLPEKVGRNLPRTRWRAGCRQRRFDSAQRGGRRYSAGVLRAGHRVRVVVEGIALGHGCAFPVANP